MAERPEARRPSGQEQVRKTLDDNITVQTKTLPIGDGTPTFNQLFNNISHQFTALDLRTGYYDITTVHRNIYIDIQQDTTTTSTCSAKNCVCQPFFYSSDDTSVSPDSDTGSATSDNTSSLQDPHSDAAADTEVAAIFDNSVYFPTIPTKRRYPSSHLSPIYEDTTPPVLHKKRHLSSPAQQE